MNWNHYASFGSPNPKKKGKSNTLPPGTTSYTSTPRRPVPVISSTFTPPNPHRPLHNTSTQPTPSTIFASPSSQVPRWGPAQTTIRNSPSPAKGTMKSVGAARSYADLMKRVEEVQKQNAAGSVNKMDVDDDQVERKKEMVNQVVMPKELIDYVNRTLDQCVSKKQKTLVMEQLQQEIEWAKRSNTVGSINWAMKSFVFQAKNKTLVQKQKRQSLQHVSSTQDLTNRRQRFGPVSSSVPSSPRIASASAEVSSEPAEELDYEGMKIVGTCETLEKSYLRLTSVPEPWEIRPVRVLEKTLELLKQKWQESHNYAYLCRQFKSIRQDLAVQHITSEFTVRVYKIHARIALECGDLSQFNQCQTQLFQIFDDHSELKSDYAEFVGYRILYFIVTDKINELLPFLYALEPEIVKDRNVSQALEIRKAVVFKNYHRFFQIYNSCSTHAQCLLKHYLKQIRFDSLIRMARCYLSLHSSFILKELGLDLDSTGESFLKASGLFFPDGKVIFKNSQVVMAEMESISQHGVTHGSFK